MRKDDTKEFMRYQDSQRKTWKDFDKKMSTLPNSKPENPVMWNQLKTEYNLSPDERYNVQAILIDQRRGFKNLPLGHMIELLNDGWIFQKIEKA